MTISAGSRASIGNSRLKRWKCQHLRECQSRKTSQEDLLEEDLLAEETSEVIVGTVLEEDEAVLEAEVHRAEVSEVAVLEAKVRRAEVSEVAVLEAVALRAAVLEAEVLRAAVSEVAVLEVVVHRAEVLEAVVRRAAVHTSIKRRNIRNAPIGNRTRATTLATSYCTIQPPAQNTRAKKQGYL